MYVSFVMLILRESKSKVQQISSIYFEKYYRPKKWSFIVCTCSSYELVAKEKIKNFYKIETQQLKLLYFLFIAIHIYVR